MHLQVHDDPPITKIWDNWYYIHPSVDHVEKRGFNPVYPEDRDGDGADADPGVPCTFNTTGIPARWDPSINPFDLDENGTPCDDARQYLTRITGMTEMGFIPTR